MAAEQGELAFAGLLRQLRREARLTQEELAEAAGISVRAVSDLERGINRTAHKDTAVLLAGALGLDDHVREVFVLAARGRVPSPEVLAAQEQARQPQQAPGAFAAVTRTLPRDSASFTGREAELGRLTAAAAAAGGGAIIGIHAIGGMAGVGKTTFAVHAAHRLTPAFPDGQYFLPLHGHTPGRNPVAVADALGSLLLAAGLAAQHLPPGIDARAARWRDFTAGKKILLMLDDATGHEQVRPLLPGTPGSLVLVTSRRRLTALEDAAVISLDMLPPADAIALLTRLAARPGIGASDPAVAEIARLCGYLPLAIGIVGGQLRHHPAWAAADLAASLVTVRDRLGVIRAENVSVAAAFGMTYDRLMPDRQRLFRRLGLIPGPTFDAYAVAALDGVTLDQARRGLDDLYDQHLITEPAPGRYLLHDLLREHARTLAAAADDPADRDAAAERLLDYYVHTAVAARPHFARWPADRDRPPPGPPPRQAPGVTARDDALAWLDAERPNLLAAVDYAATHGQHPYVQALVAAIAEFMYKRGDWEHVIALNKIALAAALQAGDRHGQALNRMNLGLMEANCGDTAAAAANLAGAVALYRDLGDEWGQAWSLCYLANFYALSGDYPAAVAGHEQALALARSAGDQFAEESVLDNLGWVQLLTGEYQSAAESLAGSLDLSRVLGHRQGEAAALTDIGQLRRLVGDYPAAFASLRRALDLFRALDDQPSQGDALLQLGRVEQLTGDYQAAAVSLHQALELYRTIGSPAFEVLNQLGELSTLTSDTRQARDYHAEALAGARDLGLLPDEACALEGIGRSHLRDGDHAEAAAYLREALAIYKRIGSPDAQRAQEALRDLDRDARPGATRPER